MARKIILKHFSVKISILNSSIFVDFNSPTLTLSVFQTAFGETHQSKYFFLFLKFVFAHILCKRMMKNASVLFLNRHKFSVPVTLPDNLINACNSLVGGSCPVQAHQTYTHGAEIEGEDDLHGGIPVQMRIEIADVDHICMCALINVIVN